MCASLASSDDETSAFEAIGYERKGGAQTAVNKRASKSGTATSPQPKINALLLNPSSMSFTHVHR